MARRKSHVDVDFAVEDHKGKERIFKTFDEAAAFAVQLAVMGRPSFLDVLVYSKSGARWYGDDWAVELYEEDPDASVFERILINADSQGRVP